MDFSQVKNIKVPSTNYNAINVVEIKDAANRILWKTGPIELLHQPETITHAIGTIPTSYIYLPREMFWASKSEVEITLTLPAQLTFESGVDTVTKYRIFTSTDSSPSYDYYDPGTITVKPKRSEVLGTYSIDIQPIKTVGSTSDVLLVGASISIIVNPSNYAYRNNIAISFAAISGTAEHNDKPDITFTIESVKCIPTTD